MAKFYCKNCYIEFNIDCKHDPYSKLYIGNILICSRCGSEWIDYIPYWQKTDSEVDNVQPQGATPLTGYEWAVNKAIGQDIPEPKQATTLATPRNGI